MKVFSLACLACLLGARLVWAAPATEEVSVLRQEVQQLTATVRDLSVLIQAQQQRISTLEQAKTTLASSVGAPAATAPGARQLPAGANLSAFNPEIGVLADIVGQFSESSADGEGNDKLNAREVEIVFGHPIDPYSRLDITTSFSDFEAAALEEAYITHWGLPAEL